MTGVPLWLAPAALAAVLGCVVVLAGRRRGPSIDLTRLTVDDPATATVEETLERAERLRVDPSKFTTGEIQNLHRMLAAEMATRPSETYLPYPWVGEH